MAKKSKKAPAEDAKPKTVSVTVSEAGAGKVSNGTREPAKVGDILDVSSDAKKALAELGYIE